MRTMMIVLVALVTIEALVVSLFPAAVKRAVESLSPGELRVAGMAELCVAVAAIYFAAVG